MKTLAESIFIELIKINESDIKYMKATRNHAKEKKMRSHEILAGIALESAMDFQNMKEKHAKQNN